MTTPTVPLPRSRFPGLAATCAAALLLAGLAGGCAPSEPAAALVQGARPIIVIDIGTLRADRLGLYGYERPTSPNLDGWAEEAVVFEWAFSQAPSTGPAQASLFTGLYPTTHGWRDDTGKLTDEVETLAEILSAEGWHTAAFVDGGFLSEGFGLEQGFEEWQNLRGQGFAATVPAAIEWLEDQVGEPFLLLVHGYDVHVPYDPPADSRAALLGDAEAAADFDASAQRLEQARQAAEQGELPLSAEELALASDLYDAEIHAADRQLRGLFEAIERLGLDERATVVVVSDHGEAFGEHGTVLHDRLYAPVTRVPFLIRFPGGAVARRIPHPVEGVDLTPTLLEIAGLEVPSKMQGDSLLPLIEERGTPRYFAFSETPAVGGASAVALAGYHLVRGEADGRLELFHLTQDPLAEVDVAALEPDKLEVLGRHLDDWQQRIARAAAGEETETSLDEETLEQLKNLGYIQ